MQHSDITHKERKRNVLGVIIAILVAVAIIGSYTFGAMASRRAEIASANSLTLAEMVKTKCSDPGGFTSDQDDLCVAAKKVVKRPNAQIIGPPGPSGKPGKPGKSGTAGDPGINGVGIVSVKCKGEGKESYWEITFTSGLKQTSTGPCRMNDDHAPASESK